MVVEAVEGVRASPGALMGSGECPGAECLLVDGFSFSISFLFSVSSFDALLLFSSLLSLLFGLSLFAA